MEAPSDLPAFLDWLRLRTEAAWSTVTPATLAEYRRRQVGGTQVQRGTRWHPLTEREVEEVEAREGRLPPSLRLYLLRLGGTDRPEVGATFVGAVLQPVERPFFYDWRRPEQIAAARAEVLDGLCFDAEHNAWWPNGVARPSSAKERSQALEAVLDGAPRLWPLVGHRHLVGDDGVVLSIHQTDVIVWGNDLRTALLNELGPALGLGGAFSAAALPPLPFWGDFS